MRKKHVKDYVSDETIEGGYRYIGNYFIDNMPDDKRKKVALTDFLLGIIEAIGVLATLSINCVGNRTIYVVIPLEICLVCLVYYISGAYTYYKNDQKMERRCYEDSYLRMVQSITVAFFLNVGSIIGQIYTICKGYYFEDKNLEYLLLVALFIIATLNCFLWICQRKVLKGVIEEKT